MIRDFKDYQSDSPCMPGYTCPTVDAGIREARSVRDSVEEAVREIEDTLEELRSNNADLRECAEYWESCTSELCVQLEDAIEERDAARARIAELEATIERLNAPLLPFHREKTNGEATHIAA